MRKEGGVSLIAPPPPSYETRLQHRPLFRDLYFVDRYVHLGHAQAREALHAVDDVAPRGLCDLGYRLTILYGHRQVHGGLFLTDLDIHAPGVVTAARAASCDTAGHTLQEPADGRGRSATHLHLLYLLRRDARYLGDHRAADRRVAHLALEGGSAASFAHARPFRFIRFTRGGSYAPLRQLSRLPTPLFKILNSAPSHALCRVRAVGKTSRKSKTPRGYGAPGSSGGRI